MKDSAAGYGAVSLINHWIGALFVLVMLGLGLLFDSLPRGEERSFVLHLHISIGALVFLFFLFRIFWRLSHGFLAPYSTVKWERVLASFTHWALLLAILVMVVTGPLAVWSGGRAIDVFGLFAIPSPMAENHDLHELMEVIHGFTAKPVLIVLIGLHILGTLKHLLFDRGAPRLRMFGLYENNPPSDKRPL